MSTTVFTIVDTHNISVVLVFVVIISSDQIGVVPEIFVFCDR